MTKNEKNKRMENKYWVARDLSGALFLTDNKPKRCTYEYGMWISEGNAIRAKENSDVPVEVVAVDKEVSQPVEGENTVSADNWGAQQEDYTLNGQPVRAIMV